MSEEATSIDALSADAGEADAHEVFCVDTEVYEGPLHLLLELARRQKVDLLQVSILTLANQYLDFISETKARRIDLAADYLLMASWLAYLKSRLLLPKPEKVETEGEDSEDMAQRLAFRLKRLDAMRKAARELTGGPILGEKVFLRGAPEQPRVVKHTEYDTTLWHLMQAFGGIRARRTKAAPHRVERQMVLPLESARQSLKSLSPELREWASLDTVRRQLKNIEPDLPIRSVTASVFSAALELTRDGDVEIRQDLHFAPLYLRASVVENMEAANDTA